MSENEATANSSQPNGDSPAQLNAEDVQVPEEEQLPNGEADEADIIEIPTLPRGRLLEFRLLSNWDDASFVGLAGIDVFLESGRKATFDDISSSSPGDSHISLIFTSPGISSWKTPFPADDVVTIRASLREDEAIAMIRVWNYAESRVHSNRGVHEMEVALDGRRIFRGFVEPAHFDDHGDTILFTTSEAVLDAIAANDVCLLPPPSTPQAERTAALGIVPQRPATSEQSHAGCEKSALRKCSTEKKRDDGTRDADGMDGVKIIHLELESTWGAPDCIGLTGVEFFDADGAAIRREDVASLSVAHGEPNGLQNLLNGRNLTHSSSDMWLTPLTSQQLHPTLAFTFARPLPIAGVSIWNYNSCAELSYAGVRTLAIHVNGRLLRRGVLLRKATGYVHFDFVQDISFERRSLRTLALPALRPQSKSATGFIYQLMLLSTWGDDFYVGLNGVELRDANDQLIVVRPNSLAAFPESVNILPQVHDDPRRSENLINGRNAPDCGAENAWLTPVLPNGAARVFFVFDTPTTVADVVVFNYSKTPERGVRHLSITVDDVIVWSGEVPKCALPEEPGVLRIPLQPTA